MSNRIPVRRLLLAAGIGLALIGGTGLAAAEPGDDDEVPHPGIVTATASCEQGTAAITVWIENADDDTPPVRLDRVRPDTATLTKDTVVDPETPDMRTAVFEPVPVGEYNVHVERGGDVRPDDVPVVVKPCGDAQPSDDLLRVEVECQAGWGLITYVITNPRTQGVAEYYLTSGTALALDKIHLSEGLFLQVTENGAEDRTYSVRLTEEKDHEKILATKRFTVACEAGNPPRVDATAACAGTTGTVTVGVVNPNRKPVGYEVSVQGVTKKLTVNGGEKGTVTFPGIAPGEHQVIVKGDDKTQAEGSAKLDCGGATTTTTTTTTTPAPQGRSDSGLANTGASVGGLVGLAALALVLGGALVMIGGRRAHGNR